MATKQMKTLRRTNPVNKKRDVSRKMNDLVSNPKMSGHEITVSCPHCDYDYLIEPEETQIECNNPECGKTFRIKVGC